MDSRYNHTLHEEKTYSLWESHNWFNPDVVRAAHPAPKKESFCVIMPPPNANDPLHIGHAMFISIEDVLIRYHRMLGDDTLWLPGTDHAGIETQFVYEKKLSKQGKSRFQFDRSTLYQNIWDYVQENSGVAVDQMKKLGASADWSRFLFTLDSPVVQTVVSTFTHLHEAGLVYRDDQLVNYCTKCGTSYSELEVKYEEKISPLYYVRYYFTDDPENYITVATVRPEPIFADTHLAVHPDDKKRNSLIGKSVLNPLTKAEMPIIADEFVDPAFGTGIVKLTPAHDANDFSVAKKHSLPIRQAIDTRGKITDLGGKYAGLSVSQARERVVNDLETAGLLEKVDKTYTNRVGVCYRCGRAIEPLPLPQFFIRVKPLTQEVVKNLDDGTVRIHGAGREKILRHWLTHLRDWNISRQIVWGIRIPVWYRVDDPSQFTVGFIDPDKQFHQGNLAQLLEEGHTFETIELGLQQLSSTQHTHYELSQEKPSKPGNWLPETDTFDTWFSSGQWPFATLQNTQPTDFSRFYPTQVMETGYDILPFWVMRMLMLGIFQTGSSPFSDVYLHGLIRDTKGQKMSKSKGNVVNPLSVVEIYGADALRMALTIRSTAGQDKSVGDADFKAMRNFTNKIWNATRFVCMTVADASTAQHGLQEVNAEFSQQLDRVVQEVSSNLQDLKPGLAAENVYNSFWHWYCDICIEQVKQGQLSHELLEKGLITFLHLLHPFVPFVTEAAYQECKEMLSSAQSEALIISPWPQIA